MTNYQTDTNYQLKRIREISSQAEVVYSSAEKLGDHAARAIGGGDEKHRSQMTGLETIANSTFKTTDIFDYVKKQTARHGEWRQVDAQSGSPNESFGLRLLNQLQGDIAKRAEVIANKLDVRDATDEDKLERRRIHLLLMREFIRQMVVQYEFAAILSNNRRRG